MYHCWCLYWYYIFNNHEPFAFIFISSSGRNYMILVFLRCWSRFLFCSSYETQNQCKQCGFWNQENLGHWEIHITLKVSLSFKNMANYNVKMMVDNLGTYHARKCAKPSKCIAHWVIITNLWILKHCYPTTDEVIVSGNHRLREVKKPKGHMAVNALESRSLWFCKLCSYTLQCAACQLHFLKKIYTSLLWLSKRKTVLDH